MPALTLQLLLDSLLALGIGLFIGLEREHSDITTHAPRSGDPVPEPETALGVRTFALLSLLGWLCGALGGISVWLTVSGLVVAGLFLGRTAQAEYAAGRGLTTEVAGLITLCLGILVHRERALAVALALFTTLLLVSKPWFRAWIPRMRRMDLTATLQLFILLAIVLPLLPEQASDPWGVLAPRRLGVFVALIAGVGYVGYLLHRVLGERRSAGLTGLVGGLLSSTAVTAAMSQRARESESMRRPAALAITLASAVMFMRVLAVAGFVAPPVGLALALPLGAMVVCTSAGALWAWRSMRTARRAKPDAELELQNPFSLWPALKWGALLAVILVATAAARDALGDAGLIATAALSGLVDVDAITLAATRHTVDGDLAPSTAALAITVAVVSNTVVKGLMAWFTGGPALGRDVAKVLGLAVAVGLAVAATEWALA